MENYSSSLSGFKKHLTSANPRKPNFRQNRINENTKITRKLPNETSQLKKMHFSSSIYQT